MPVDAVQHIRKMRGGAQAHLMRGDDGFYYVVKFQNNPQHLKILVNELLASRLAQQVGLPVPMGEIVTVDEWLIGNTPELRIEDRGHYVPCRAGLQFGARYVCDPFEGQVFDYLPESMFEQVRNRETFAGMLALDKWLGNTDGRQVVFWRKGAEKNFAVSFIDHGFCFNAGDWTFPDRELHGIYYRNYVYARVTGWESFEPWLSRIEKLDSRMIREAAGDIPPEWSDDWEALHRLVETVIQRRAKVRELIAAFRDSERKPFPGWKIGASGHRGTGASVGPLIQ